MFFGFFGDPDFSFDFDLSVFDFSTFFSVFFSAFLLLVPFSLGFELFLDPFETNFPFSRASIGLSESVTFFEPLFESLFEWLFSVFDFSFFSVFDFSALGFFATFALGELDFSVFLFSIFFSDSSFLAFLMDSLVACFYCTLLFQYHRQL